MISQNHMATNILTQNDIQHVDYKDVDLLKQFVNPHGRVQSRKRTNLTAKQQRAVEAAVKRARFMGLLPYVQK
jgi:small subunit ribosomal protein S18